MQANANVTGIEEGTVTITATTEDGSFTVAGSVTSAVPVMMRAIGPERSVKGSLPCLPFNGFRNMKVI